MSLDFALRLGWQFVDPRHARTLRHALRMRRDLAVSDHRFISRAIFALFRWRGWIEPLGLARPEERLLPRRSSITGAGPAPKNEPDVSDAIGADGVSWISPSRP